MHDPRCPVAVVVVGVDGAGCAGAVALDGDVLGYKALAVVGKTVGFCENPVAVVPHVQLLLSGAP